MQLKVEVISPHEIDISGFVFCCWVVSYCIEYQSPYYSYQACPKQLINWYQ